MNERLKKIVIMHVEKKKNSSCLRISFKEMIHYPGASPATDNLDISLSISQDESFFKFSKIIFESVKFAFPPEIFQFYKLIFEDNSQLTFKNIKNHDVVPFLISLLSMSTAEPVLEACLSVICMLIFKSEHLFKEFIQNDILDFLPDIYSYASQNVQTLIAKLYVIITDLDTEIDDDTKVHIILRCTQDFINTSVNWAACHSIQECQSNCILFQYNIIVGSDKQLPKELISELSSSLLSILISEDIPLVCYSAYAIGCLIQIYSLSLDLKDIFNCLFLNIKDKLLIDTDASIPVLRMTVKALRYKEDLPPAEEVLPIINWPVLCQKMISSDHEISYLACRVCQHLIRLGVECIDAVLSNKILDAACSIYEDGAFKSMCEISLLLKNIWSHGNLDQQKAVFCHNIFLLFLKFAEGAEMNDIGDCFHSMYVALKSVTDIDLSFIPLLIKHIPSNIFCDLSENNNDDVSNYSKIIFDVFYIQNL